MSPAHIQSKILTYITFNSFKTIKTYFIFIVGHLPKWGSNFKEYVNTHIISLMQTCRSQFIIWSHSYFVAFSIHIIYCILAWYFTCLFLDFDKVKLIQSLINQSIQRSCDQFFTDQLLLIEVIMWPVLHRPVTARTGDHVTSTSWW